MGAEAWRIKRAAVVEWGEQAFNCGKNKNVGIEKQALVMYLVLFPVFDSRYDSNIFES
jgi:hypothetical protein